MNRRLATLLAAALPAVALFVLATTVTVPLVAMGPGPTYDTLGETEVHAEAGPQRVPVIEVTGRDSDEFGGQLRMTTVAVRDSLTLVDGITMWLDADQTLVPRDQVFPPDRTRDEVTESNRAAMSTSEHTAEAAAYNHLGIPMSPRIEEVMEDAAAAEVLEPGDRISAVNGSPVETAGDVADAIGAHGPGDEVSVRYERDGRPGEGTLTLRAGPEGSDPERGVAGILVGDVPTDGTDVTIHIDPEIGGPSAGMMFALGIIDKLSPGVLSGGAEVAGSGTVTADGEIGPIGGVTHKITAARDAGATLFLVAGGNCAEAAAVEAPGITLARVDTIDDAVTALETYAEGEAPVGCGL